MATNPFIPAWLHRTVTAVHFINCFIVAATLIAYAIAQLSGVGTIIQLFLGCYQLAIAILATLCYWRWKVPAIGKLLKIYWLCILAWLVCAGILAMQGMLGVEANSQAIVMELFVLPMFIAIYFVYVTYRIYSDFNQPES